jgi:hypothetical protein
MKTTSQQKDNTMTREDFKRLAAGNYALREQTIDAKEMNTYVEGAIFAYDLLNKHDPESIKTAGQRRALSQWQNNQPIPTTVVTT